MTDKLNIEIVPAGAPESKAILLGDLNAGDVVELKGGYTALVVRDTGAVRACYKINAFCLILLTDSRGDVWGQMGKEFAEDAIGGRMGAGRIVKVLGPLSGITVKEVSQ